MLTTADSPRLRHRATKEAAIAAARHLDEQLFEASQARRSRTLVELPEPIRCGWEREFYVRADLARSPEGLALAGILRLIQNVEVSRRKDFAERDWNRGGKLAAREHRPRELSEKEFYALDPAFQRQFSIVVHRDRGRVIRKTFAYQKPWQFISRLRPYYLTHTELPASEADSRVRHVESRLYGKGWPMRHLIRHWGASNYWNFDELDWNQGPTVDDWREEIREAS